ncbi:uncharacterized protein cubi_01162 [Cryptosporidium ubiquitum]|uniref:TRIP4/RQT4 C2HC5-type zinc finger domain-containing protein n=1 Tax=Cryptosporidium ubiquitum TaxID=857276 RepID=A0A1J4MJE3_9CRYT|nr:uncharacterized protein cubi_01162 [Cryptosporidium ubiquitum]OII74318.1 hypothetical protein cubi_01162 [Cryptosporidium ubiquitum]
MRSIRISDIQFQHKKVNKKNNKNNISLDNDNEISSSSVGAKAPVLECGCYGKLHALYITCIQCGRISCELEKELVESKKECIYCKSKLTKDEDGDRIPIGCGKDEEIAHYFQALERRDKLLEYAKNSTNRTRVIDEETDWFSEFENPWNTREERLLALKMSKESAENAAKNIENRQITMDEGHKARSQLHYAKLLEEFEQRRENKADTNSGETDTNVENLLSMLGQRLKFEDESKFEGIFGLPTKEVHNNEFLPLSLDDSVWSDQDD